MSHPTFGVWEAADLNWWWRTPRDTDQWNQRFWLDSDGHPVAAAVATDWGGRIGLDIIPIPSLGADSVRVVVQRGLDVVADIDKEPVEVMVDDDDARTVALLHEAGFSAVPGQGVSAWMRAEGTPPTTGLADGYRLRTRDEISSAPHHFITRIGSGVEERLRQTSLYRPDLDLVITDSSGCAVSYGLFWYDPETRIGLVEPMGTSEQHGRKGLARHVLTEGLNRLSDNGATRIKINYEATIQHRAGCTWTSDLRRR